MPDGFDIAQRGGMRGGFPGMRGGFPGMRGGFPRGRFPMMRFPRRFPMRFRRFPRFFFFPGFFPQDGCFFDRFGRCCDRFGRCDFSDDFGFDDFGPFASSDDSVAVWSPSDTWERIEDSGFDGDYYT